MKVLDTGIASAQKNMDDDAAYLMKLADHPEALLRFYEWEKPSATYGYFSHPNQYLKPNIPLCLARRPTGGGIIFHLTDLAFSVFIPSNHNRFTVNTLDNYRFINTRVAHALQLFERSLNPTLLPEAQLVTEDACHCFCMAQPTQYDVMIDQKKIAGGAQRRTRHGFLHQGSICIALPDEETLKTFFKDNSPVFEAMEKNSYSLLNSHTHLLEAKAELKKCLAEAFKN